MEARAPSIPSLLGRKRLRAERDRQLAQERRRLAATGRRPLAAGDDSAGLTARAARLSKAWYRGLSKFRRGFAGGGEACCSWPFPLCKSLLSLPSLRGFAGGGPQGPFQVAARSASIRAHSGEVSPEVRYPSRSRGSPKLGLI
jgi:hypothetical protein